MTRSQTFWYSVATTVGLMIVALLIGCGSPPLAQPDKVASVAPAIIQETAVSEPTSPPITTTSSSPLATPVAAMEPTVTPPVATPTPGQNPATSETSSFSDGQIQPEIIEPRGGILRLDLAVPDEVSALASPAGKIVYTSREPPWVTSSIWVADTQDVSQKTELIRFSKPEGFPFGAVLSPDGRWVAYALYADEPRFQGILQILNVETQEVISLAPDLYVRVRGGKTIVWSPDSTALAYVTVLGEVYLVHVETGHKQLLTRLDDTDQPVPSIGNKRDIVLIGWSSANQVYYAAQEGERSWHVRAVNSQTDRQEDLGVFKEWLLDDASLSPDEYKILLSLEEGCSVLTAGSEPQAGQVLATKFSCGSRPIWNPDSRGVLGSFNGEIFAATLAAEDVSSHEAARRDIKIPVPANGKIFGWSPDGRYLAYWNISARDVWLLEVDKGQKQRIAEPIREVAGWITEK